MLENSLQHWRASYGLSHICRNWVMVAAVLVPSLTTGADLWVDRNSLGGPCSDNRDRSHVSKVTPWCTLEAAGATVQPGDVVHVREGEYTKINDCPGCSNYAVLEISVTGTAEAPIKFVAEPGEDVVLSGAGGAARGIQFVVRDGNVPRFVEVNGFIARDFDEEGVFIRDVSDITIRNVEVTGCRKGAIENHWSARITIEGCRIHHNHMTGWTSAIDLYKCKDDNVVRGNYIWANTDEDDREAEGQGIIMDYCREAKGAVIENNVIWDNEGWCITIHHSNNADIRNNTCWQNSLGRNNGTGELNARGENITIHNNILVSRGSGPALKITGDEDPATISSDFNIFWSTHRESKREWFPRSSEILALYPPGPRHRWDAHSLRIDPLFVAPVKAVFELTARSPAVDSGDDSHASTRDAAGVKRPIDGNQDGRAQVDRGALEFAP